MGKDYTAGSIGRWVAVSRNRPLPPPPEPLPDRIARRIESGEWAELPLIRDIAAAFGRSHTTVSAALYELADRGLVGLDRARWIVVTPDRPLSTPSDPLPDRIAQRIESGEWVVLPTLVEIAATFGCAPDTVSAALCELADRGLVGKKPTAGGKGRWIVVAPDQPLPPFVPVADRIAHLVESGEWAVLPRIVDIAAAFRCASTTVITALRELADRGLVGKDYAERGSGRWVVVTRDRSPRCRSADVGTASVNHALGHQLTTSAQVTSR